MGNYTCIVRKCEGVFVESIDGIWDAKSENSLGAQGVSDVK